MRWHTLLVVAIGCGGSSAHPGGDAGVDTPPDAAMLGCAPGDGTAQPVCMFDHLCWEYPLPIGEDVSAIGGGGCDYWLAGDGMFRLHGATLTHVATPFERASAVQVFPTEAWAAGPAGVTRFDGTAWTTVDGTAALGLWGTAPDDLWVSRLDGMAHWDGAQLVHVETPSPLPLLAAVWGTGPTDIRAIVQSSSRGFLRWDGATWTREVLPGSVAVLGAWGDAPDDWYVVTKVDGHGEILHFDGSAWTVVHDEPGPDELHAIWGSSSHDVWVGGTIDHVLHFDGTSWASIALPTTVDLDAIHGSGPDDVVFYGAGFLGRWDGTQIVSLSPQSPLALTGTDWVGLYAPGANERWLVARNGTVVHWDGTQWSREVVTHEVISARAITGSGPDDVWLGGSSATHRLWHRAAGAWTPVELPGEGAIVAMYAASATDVWAVDENGAVYHYDGAWSAPPVTLDDPSLVAVWGTATDAWVVGGGLNHWDGTTWTSFYPPELQFAFSVWGRASDDVYFGDQNGTLFHWDGQAVATVAQLPGASILSIGGDATRMWFAGKAVIAYDDGSGLRVFREGRHTWRAAAFPVQGDGWIVGSTNAVLRYQP